MKTLKELMAEATPLPWSPTILFKPDSPEIRPRLSDETADKLRRLDADEHLKVHCVNTYAALLGAAEHLGWCDFPDEIEHRCDGCVAARAAIAKANNVEAK